MTSKTLPLFVSGIVTKGFGRGSKDLGIPTANFTQEVVDKYAPDLATGVYYGWARVDEGEIHSMVMSIGWNPFYKNKHKSMETHILHEYPEDFYGHFLRVLIVGYIRPEMDFKSVDDLIIMINSDIKAARDKMQNETYDNCKELTAPISNGSLGCDL